MSELTDTIYNTNTGAIWKRLTPGERREFERLVDSGDISKMVPEHTPWWEFRDVSQCFKFSCDTYSVVDYMFVNLSGYVKC